MSRRLWNLRRSITVQLGVLTTVFIVLVTAYLLASFYSNVGATQGAPEYEYSRARSELSGAMVDPRRSPSMLEGNEALKKIKAANPDFRYLAISPKGRFSSEGDQIEPRFPELLFEETTEIKQLSELTREKLGREYCAFAERGNLSFDDNGALAIVEYSHCLSAPYYLEISGIENSAFSSWDKLTDFFQTLMARTYQYYLIVGFGVLLIALFMIFRMLFLMSRVSRATQQIDLGRLTIDVDAQKMPPEIAPMVQSLNSMIRRIRESSDRQNMFLAAAAHELKTPMTVLRMRLEGIEDSPAKQEICADLQRMGDLVEQLLRLTKLKSKDDLSFVPVNLVAVVQDLCAKRAPLALEENVELELDTEGPKVVINGEHSMVATAIANVLDNAISVSNAGDIVSIMVQNDGNVTIRDRGQGLPSTDEIDIFEPFAKLPRNRNGHGLGLAIVRQIMRLHDGEISARNSRSGGAVISLRFQSVADRPESASNDQKAGMSKAFMKQGYSG